MSELSRKEREKLAKKNEILQAACKVFAEKGYHKATLDEIAEAAEFSKGALYLYFSSKEDLFHEITSTGIGELIQIVQTAISEMENPKDQLNEIIKAYLTFVEENKNFFKVYWEQRLYMEQNFDDSLRENKMQFLDIINNIIKKCQTAELITTSYSYDDLASILFGTVTGILFHWLRDHPNESLIERSNMIIDIFWNGAGIN